MSTTVLVVFVFVVFFFFIVMMIMSKEDDPIMTVIYLTQEETPVRIQRKRRLGWRMPENTVYVGRPTIWGNYCQGKNREEEIRLFKIYAIHKDKNDPTWLQALRGKNLACWCALDQQCHADILLELANK